MNNTFRALSYCWLFFIITAANCKKDKAPIDQLPPETQEGKGTFGCLINGEAMVAKTDLLGSPTIVSYYQHIYAGDHGYVFQATGGRDGDYCEFKSVIINADSVLLEEGKTYKLTDCVRGSFCGEYNFGLYGRCTIPFYNYHTSSLNTGELTIKKFDQTKLIVSGTFWFDVLDSVGVKVEIREGRFDLKYTR